MNKRQKSTKHQKEQVFRFTSNKREVDESVKSDDEMTEFNKVAESSHYDGQSMSSVT